MADNESVPEVLVQFRKQMLTLCLSPAFSERSTISSMVQSMLIKLESGEGHISMLKQDKLRQNSLYP